MYYTIYVNSTYSFSDSNWFLDLIFNFWKIDFKKKKKCGWWRTRRLGDIKWKRYVKEKCICALDNCTYYLLPVVPNFLFGIALGLYCINIIQIKKKKGI